MENAIRRHLSDNGYFGGTAKLRTVRLAAVQRPGWLQVYRFEATARLADPSHADANLSDACPPDIADSEDDSTTHRPVYHELFGLVREDHRKDQTAVRFFKTHEQRAELFLRWSEGLITLRGGQAIQ
jgi:hypothetical protein